MMTSDDVTKYASDAMMSLLPELIRKLISEPECLLYGPAIDFTSKRQRADIKVGDVIDWSCTPDHALVLVQDGEDIRDWYFRHGDHGWWVGGEPTLLGKAEFIPSISPLGNGWPEWSGWHFERCTVVALNLRGDETGEELLALAGGPT